jgi:hypothetical protein
MTAVEWYSNKLVEIFGDMCNEFTQEQTLANHYALKQAKEMEKQQIMKSNRDGVDMVLEGKPFLMAEQYFNETYKK